jgi:hypothetical protein
MSGYSVHGFEDANAKHTTSFEAKVPEAGDPETFPHCKEQSPPPEIIASTSHVTPHSGPKSVAGFDKDAPEDLTQRETKKQSIKMPEGFHGRL